MDVEEKPEGEVKITPTQISQESQTEMKKKQTQNIIRKIKLLVEKVHPIHEAFEEDEDPDMSELIEQLSNMDIE